jgi:hypothetical protein
MKISKDFEEFFALLNQHKIEYLVIGGYAFAIYAEPRYTKDLDIFYRSDERNADKLLEVLSDFGFQSGSITTKDLMRKGKIFQLGNPPLRIDLLNDIDGISFNEAWQNRASSEYGEEMIQVIGKNELIKNKRASGREQDQLDVKRLEE